MRKMATTAIAGIAAVAASLTMAGMASASTGAPRISPEESGYSATGAQFKNVGISVYLRNPEQYGAVVASYGHSVQLWSSSLVMVLGVSDTTARYSAGAGFGPAVALFDRNTHALLASSTNGTIPAQWRPAGGSSQPWSPGNNFPTGTTVTERMRYDPAAGDVTFRATDPAGDRFTATYQVGAGQSFTQARIGTEFGTDPWTAPAFTPPSKWAKIAVYNDARLVSYSGHVGTLDSWWFNHALEANTGAQNDTGDWVAIPSDLANEGASFATAFVPASGQRPVQAGPLALHAGS
jgi:hypothetical protein